jgi:hypothetical protein
MEWHRRNWHRTSSRPIRPKMFSLASRYARVQIPDRFLFAFAHLIFCAAATVAREKRGFLGKLLGLPSVRVYRKSDFSCFKRVSDNSAIRFAVLAGCRQTRVSLACYRQMRINSLHRDRNAAFPGVSRSPHVLTSDPKSATLMSDDDPTKCRRPDRIVAGHTRPLNPEDACAGAVPWSGHRPLHKAPV